MILAAAALGAAGCMDDSITGDQPLALEVEVTPANVAVADSVTARFAATGSGLQGVVVGWGDGAADTLLLNGLVVEVQWSMTHSYGAIGEYDVTVTARDQRSSRTASGTVSVR